MAHSCQQGGAQACDKGENRRNIYTISTSIYPSGTNKILFRSANTQAGKSRSARLRSSPDVGAVKAGSLTKIIKQKKNNTHIKCFQLNRQSREKKKQREHFPLLDLCDSITLNILSPEQAQLPSNRCSQPLMRLARSQRKLPGLLIARLKSLYLIGPEIQKGIISTGRSSKKPNCFF